MIFPWPKQSFAVTKHFMCSKLPAICSVKYFGVINWFYKMPVLILFYGSSVSFSLENKFKLLEKNLNFLKKGGINYYQYQGSYIYICK